MPASSSAESFLTRSKLFSWVSQPLSETSTKGTPDSTSRRASRQPWPKGVGP